jgi:hypothetical protein
MMRGIRALIAAAVLLVTLPDVTLAKTRSTATSHRRHARSSHRVGKYKAPKLNKKNAYKVKPYRKFKKPKR